MKFSIKDFFSECDQMRSFQRIWSQILKKSLMENFIFCAVSLTWKGLHPRCCPVQTLQNFQISYSTKHLWAAASDNKLLL